MFVVDNVNRDNLILQSMHIPEQKFPGEWTNRAPLLHNRFVPLHKQYFWVVTFAFTATDARTRAHGCFSCSLKTFQCSQRKRLTFEVFANSSKLYFFRRPSTLPLKLDHIFCGCPWKYTCGWIQQVLWSFEDLNFNLLRHSLSLSGLDPSVPTCVDSVWGHGALYNS